TDAARKGCRTGILPYTSNAAVTADVNAVMTQNNIAASTAKLKILVNGVAGDVSTAKLNHEISIQVSVPPSQVSMITPLFFPGTDIESETVFMMSQKNN